MTVTARDRDRFWQNLEKNKRAPRPRAAPPEPEVGLTVISEHPDKFRFDSVCLPRNYTYHKEVGGEFHPDGSCRFNSWREIERTVRHAQANGEPLLYDGSRKELRPD